LRKIRREFVKKGEEEFFALFDQTGTELTPSILNRILDYYNINKRDDLFYAIANNDVELPDKPEKLLKLKKQQSENVILRYVKQAFNGSGKKNEKVINKHISQKETYLLKEEGFHKNFTIAPCCSPIPGDNVLGYLTEDNEVIVHKVTCPEVLKLKASYGNRILSAEWGNYSQYSFLSTLIINGIDRVGMLREISTEISTDSVNIKSLTMESNDGVFEGRISLYVHNVDDIQKICTKIMKIDGVKSVNRVNE
jgi:GTP pyrophosphokinase